MLSDEYLRTVIEIYGISVVLEVLREEGYTLSAERK